MRGEEKRKKTRDLEFQTRALAPDQNVNLNLIPISKNTNKGTKKKMVTGDWEDSAHSQLITATEKN